MALSEFELIAHYFEHQRVKRPDVILGIGDDCALLQPPAGQELALTVDTLLEGVHFPIGTKPADIGHKALAASLSDLAAMGAEPAWATLSLALPDPDESWLEPFASGLFALAEQHGVQLVGGDTVRGPLAVTIQAQGTVPAGAALRRGGAMPGDLVFVTGTLGDAGAGLDLVLGRRQAAEETAESLLARLNRPEPRVAEGAALRGIASAAIDISDGLAADLGHIISASGTGATLHLEALPFSSALESLTSEEERFALALGAGDDYELCFTVSQTRRTAVERLFERFACGCRCVGTVEEAPGLHLNHNGTPFSLPAGGYDHFRGQ
jgi:thiamine-monophosphate kinase